MRIKVTETVDIDIDAWATEYGIDPTAKAVREDVQRHLGSQMQEWVRDMGLEPEGA